MPRAPFPTENLFHGTTWTDAIGTQWVWREVAVNEAQDEIIGAWHQVAQENSKVFRATKWVSITDEDKTITFPEGQDCTVMITGSTPNPITGVVFSLPATGFDGQVITMKNLRQTDISGSTRPGGLGMQILLLSNEMLSFQYFASEQWWYSL